MRSVLLAIAVATLTATVAGAQTAERVDLAQVADGHVYYARRGATLEQHNAALLQCIADTASPRIGRPMPLGEGLAFDLIWGGVLAGATAGRTENCMIVRGWDVYRLPADEGQALGRASQADLATHMALLIGADTPRGELVRSFSNESAHPTAHRFSSRPARPSNDHLSLRLIKDLDVPVSSAPFPADLATTGRPIRGAKVTASPPPGSGVLLIQLKNISSQWGTGVAFDRLPATAEDGTSTSPRTYARVFARRHWAGANPQGNWLAITVPAGRWHLSLSGFTLFCLGAPAFEIGSGEIVFAGTFDLGGDDLGPDLDMASVHAWLESSIAERVRPAAYQNGGTFSCNNAGFTIYALEVPGAPFDPAYRGGGAEPPPLPLIAGAVTASP
jgi:hypothetical protein